MAGAGCSSLRLAYEPRLQASGAPKAIRPPATVAEKSPSRASSTAPATPSARPAQLVALTRSPPRRLHSASHIGIVVTTVAIRPEPMPARCASTTRFIAANTINAPTSVACAHWRAVGRRSPRHSAQAIISTPATTKRLAFSPSGGISRRAMPMAK